MNRTVKEIASLANIALVALLALSLVALVGCGGSSTEETAEVAPMETFPPQLPGYAAMTVPDTNPMTPEKVALGKQLYYDKRLSGDGNRSCYGCHVEEYGLTDGRAKALGAFDKELTRSAPTMWNVGYHENWYWDGRSGALEAQVKGAWGGGNMGASGNDGAPSMDQVCANLMEIPGYAEQFNAIYGEAGCTPDNVGSAVASFMRTIISSDSDWIRFRNGDDSAFSAEEKAGYELFSGRAKCINCHDGLLITDLQFHNVGIGVSGDTVADPGRMNVTKDEKDNGAFKTPTLIDISKSAPYFHDGSVATLEEAVHVMATGGIANQWLDEENLREVREANLTAEDEASLVAFLRALDANYNITEPTLP